MVKPMRPLIDSDKHQGCLGCQACESGPVVTQHSGKVVCSSCESYRRECEAREMNAMPIDKRREQFRKIAEKRGQTAADLLWSDMRELNK